ncbi:hypothetical protein WR25_22217 [Diploscapter pachys]|uniref:G-protein coupled receptors family 1 profile domain-containing protein n=1 Tax=Diploscapter pachys TaxID=2018661 RepID=A0A2A2KS19_9BILA|nr:hypothetical protein WR25_22217 [Diploscapter pachys]
MTSRSLLYTVVTATESGYHRQATLISNSHHHHPLETIIVPDENPVVSPHLRVILAVVVLLTIVTTVVGNALVCLAVLLVRKLKQPPNYLIVSLALADLFVGLVVMPLALADLLFDRWPLGGWMCQLWTTSDLTLCTASIVNLCIISVDRYLVICNPLRYGAQRTTQRMLVYIGIVWLIALSVGFSSHLIASLFEPDNHEQSQHSNSCQVSN